MRYALGAFVSVLLALAVANCALAQTGTGTGVGTGPCDCSVDAVVIQAPHRIADSGTPGFNDLKFLVVYVVHSANKDAKCSYKLDLTITEFDKFGSLRGYTSQEIPLTPKAGNNVQEVVDKNAVGKAGVHGYIDIVATVTTDDGCASKTAFAEIQVITPTEASEDPNGDRGKDKDKDKK